MNAFEPSARQEASRHPLEQASEWYTWSAAAREIVQTFADHVPAIPAPTQRRIVRGGIYAVTYHLDACNAIDNKMERRLCRLAAALRELALPASGLLLLRDLYDRAIDGPVIHALFSRLRAIMEERDNSTAPTLYAPIEPCAVLRSHFPLRADLFPAPILWTVFDDLPVDGSGASLLLSRDALINILERTASIPCDVRQRVVATLEERWTWRDELVEASTREAVRVSFEPGQGYLLDDRRWLHGREMQSVPVTTDRLHRLVFSLSDAAVIA